MLTKINSGRGINHRVLLDRDGFPPSSAVGQLEGAPTVTLTFSGVAGAGKSTLAFVCEKAIVEFLRKKKKDGGLSMPAKVLIIHDTDRVKQYKKVGA